jgi:hypothetical protein
VTHVDQLLLLAVDPSPGRTGHQAPAAGGELMPGGHGWGSNDRPMPELPHPAGGQREHGRYAEGHAAEIQRAFAACPVCDGTGSTRDTYYTGTGREYAEAEPCECCRGTGVRP